MEKECKYCKFPAIMIIGTNYSDNSSNNKESGIVWKGKYIKSTFDHISFNADMIYESEDEVKFCPFCGRDLTK